MPIRIIIADDHPVTVLGLTSLFNNEKDFLVIKTVFDGREALRAVWECLPDILLLDIAMPILDGVAVLKELYSARLECKSILHTYQMDDDYLLEAMQWGVRGVILKTQPPEILLQIVREVHAGKLCLEIENIGQALVNSFERQTEQRRIRELLTPQELELVKVVAQGLRNQAIAQRLHIQEGTVRAHLHNIYEKLGLEGRGALIVFAQQHGLT